MIKMRNLTEFGSLGAKIQYNMTQIERNSFWRAHEKSDVPQLERLSRFCRFKHSATCLRLAGRHDEAELSDVEADMIFDRDIDVKDRW